MGIKEEIESIELEFEEGYDLSGNSIVKEIVGEKSVNGQLNIKIEISSAIFIHRQYVEGPKYTTVEVFSFNQVKKCDVVLKEKESVSPSIDFIEL